MKKFFNRWAGKMEFPLPEEERQKKRLQIQKEYRKRTLDGHTKRYEKTISGFLMRSYRNMKSRVTGVQKKKAHLYAGLEILPKEDFYSWAHRNNEFHRLWRDWVASGFNKKLTPTVNRIDTSFGYYLDNIEWLTHSENSSLGSLGRKFKEMKTIRRLCELNQNISRS